MGARVRKCAIQLQDRVLLAKLSASDLIVQQSPEGGEEKPLLDNEHAKGYKDHSSRHPSQKDKVQ